MTSDAASKAEEPGRDLPDQAVPDEDAPRIAELQEEIGQLKEAVTSHAVVDQAIGMMVALGRVTPDDGWAVLREVSQHTNIKLRNVAEMILVWGQKGDLPPDVRATLEDTLDRYGPTSLPEDSPPLR
ncbi:ANTAR domain-containing protein [Streptomyces sp. ActVer]|uniref:ANTAR domain-containing protein n=1 Tax=Streptomyces sp. ActVer TaxID=3014558 RepID=UPI0022B49933|nr:ANTAR domain-containing protein [Streptomyces sp. ActVer]MCZ4509680.1 ANTAR domain-containing protein [Streptomyces sp. ActVer]